MFEALAEWLDDPTVRGWYLVFCMGVMIVPMLALAIWYHWNVRRTLRGRSLMRRQSSAAPRTMRGYAEAGRMARDIAVGRYGGQVKRLQRTTYWIVALWVVACIVVFGILLVADEMNRPVEAKRGHAADFTSASP